MQAERFQHQIVGAAIETANPRVDLLACCQHQHRQISIHDSQLLQYLFSILYRQIEIQDCEVGNLIAKRIDGGSAVMDQTDPMPFGFQTAHQEQAQRLIVFGD
jgi:hypothetical protein